MSVMRVQLIKSPNPKKKWRVLFEKGPPVDFGAASYSDYTIHHDPLRMRRYVARHASRENWKDVHTAGFWSRWLLWSRPNLSDAKKLLRTKFSIVFV